MTYQTLHRRQTQRALLADACQRHAAARLSLRSGSQACCQTRLLALRSDDVIVDWNRPLCGCEQHGSAVDVRFAHAGQRFCFASRTRGLCGEGPPGAAAALRLAFPLRIERLERRRHARVSLRCLETVGRFTSMLDDRRAFDGLLTDVSGGGLGALIAGTQQLDLRSGEPFWIEFELPQASTRFEFTGRLTHQRLLGRNGQIAQGWTFLGADDAVARRAQLHQLERIRRAALSRGAGRAKRREEGQR